MSLVVAMDTATACCSVAVGEGDGRLLAEIVVPTGPAHTQRLLPDLHHALAMAGAVPEDIGTVVVGLGPGTFTGLRIGVATARALAQVSGARLVGVPSLQSLLVELRSGDPLGGASAYVALVDGKRREVFAAVLEAPSAAGATAADVQRPLVVAADDIPELLGRHPGALVGGDGARLYRDLLPPPATLSPLVGSPTAAMALRAWRAGAAGVVEGWADVVPIYGREPDAQRWSARPQAGRRSAVSEDP